MAKASTARLAPKPGGRLPVRLLPALIFVAVLMLSVRANDIFVGFSDLVPLRLATELEAQQPARGKGPGDLSPTSTPAGLPNVAAAPASPTGATSDQSMSQTEMDVLQKLSERRGKLDAREKEIERREALLKAGEEQIDRKVAELKSLQSIIENLLRRYNEQEDNKMRSLVKIYENMKPKEAAKIFEQLDMEILLEVVERMKEQRVAPILAEMDPGKARNVTSELAQRRQIPVPKPVSGR